MSRAMCRTSALALGLAKGTFPALGFSFPQPPDDTKRPLRRRERGMLKEATISDKIDGKFIPHLSAKMVRFSFHAASSLNFFFGGGGGWLAVPFSSVQDWTEERAKRPQRRRARRNGCFRRLGAKVCYDLWNVETVPVV